MLRNTTTEWGLGARIWHWVGALAILVLLTHGWWMTHFPPREARLAHYAWHSSLGYDFLALLVVRVLWLWANPAPALPADLKPWERRAAHAGHIGLYLLMLLATLTGWALAGTFRQPLDSAFFGLVRMPQFFDNTNAAAHEFFEVAHVLLSWGLALLVIVHVAGALRHHFWKRNDVLRRMTWGLR